MEDGWQGSSINVFRNSSLNEPKEPYFPHQFLYQWMNINYYCRDSGLNINSRPFLHWQTGTMVITLVYISDQIRKKLTLEQEPSPELCKKPQTPQWTHFRTECITISSTFGEREGAWLVGWGVGQEQGLHLPWTYGHSPPPRDAAPHPPLTLHTHSRAAILICSSSPEPSGRFQNNALKATSGQVTARPGASLG